MRAEKTLLGVRGAGRRISATSMNDVRRQSAPVMVLAMIAFLLPFIQAFQISMLASSSNSPSSRKRNTILRPPSFGLNQPPLPGTPDITSALISQLAIIALKSRLKGEEGVKCDVSLNSSELILGGLVGPVTIRGKGWRSGRDLSCRALEATVEQCQLDTSKILTHRKILLTQPALGKMMVALNGNDFGNFITHPLMPPVELDGETVVFAKEGAEVDPVSGTVKFYISYGGVRWTCLLKRGPYDQKAVVDVLSATTQANDTAIHELSGLLADFFNELVWNLDGTYLRYRAFKVTDKGKSPTVMFSLNIKVEKLPSPSGLDF